MKERNLCLDCYRECKVRNEKNNEPTISCDGFVKDFNASPKTMQTELGFC